jgi:enediyne biosynthesis protein E4
VGSQTDQMTTSVGYASSSDYGVHFGLGTARTVDRVELSWPSGVKQTVDHVTANRVLTVTEPRK